MLSKKDKLLIKPWEQRKYENHLYKIQSAVPVIDNRPPQFRSHVYTKVKKRQKELERIRDIENNNLTLLRRITYVMNKNRVDNWNKSADSSKFLSRVPIGYNTRRARSCTSMRGSSLSETDEVDSNQNRNIRCSACSSHQNLLWNQSHDKLKDSERVPFVPPKMFTKMERSKSVPPLRSGDGIISQKNNAQKNGKHLSKSANFENRRNKDEFLRSDDFGRKLVISRGSLHLSVRFPSDTRIKLHEGSKEKHVF